MMKSNRPTGEVSSDAGFPLVKATKRLSANDLGITGTHQSGILIPKDPSVLGLFPTLDVTRLNPDCVIDFYVPNFDQYRQARFVYYNGRDLGMGTRSEYRLTRIAGLLREFGAQVGDQLEFRREQSGEVRVELREAEEIVQVEARRLRSGWVMTVED